MGGGLLQLVAYGAQDAYITGNPHITFWKVLYKRHTNFAMEAMRVNFTGTPSYGQRSVVVVNRNADLMFRTYVEVTMPDTRASATGAAHNVMWTTGCRRRLGYLLIQQVEIEIGGQVMDRHYGEWMYLWESLTSPVDQSIRLDQMLGDGAQGTSTTPQGCGGRPAVLYIPLSFWFCRNPGLALPLIALQYHEVRLNFIFRQATDLVMSIYDDGALGTNQGTWANGVVGAAAALPRFKDAAVYVDYIYLDTDERRRFAQQSHEYLIDQLQYGLQQSVTSQTVRLDLTLNHPVKELVWVYQDARKLDCSLPATTTGPAGTVFSTQPFSYDDIANRCRLQLNGQDRFDERYGDYFWKVQPYQHHSGGAFERFRLGAVAIPPDSTTTGTSWVYAAQAQTATVTGTPAYLVVTAAPASGFIAVGSQITSQSLSGGAANANVVGATIIAQVSTSVAGIVAPSAVTSTINPALLTVSGALGGIGVYVLVPANVLTDAGYTAAASPLTGTWATSGTVVVSAQAGSTDPFTLPQTNPINVYSFSLAPEEHQPSGSCNFSRIDTTTLVFDSITGSSAGALAAGQFPSKNYPYLFRMYAVNYNIFRVMSGMGGLAYSN